MDTSLFFRVCDYLAYTSCMFGAATTAYSASKLGHNFAASALFGLLATNFGSGLRNILLKQIAPPFVINMYVAGAVVIGALLGYFVLGHTNSTVERSIQFYQKAVFGLICHIGYSFTDGHPLVFLFGAFATCVIGDLFVNAILSKPSTINAESFAILIGCAVYSALKYFHFSAFILLVASWIACDLALIYYDQVLSMKAKLK